MGRHSRSRTAKGRKVQQKKAEVAKAKGVDPEPSGGGGLMSMRAGLKAVAGNSDQPASTSSSILSWIVVGVLVIALISFFIAR